MPRGNMRAENCSDSVEFPAVGYRHLSHGSLGGAGAKGEYWSSVAYYSTGANIMLFNGGSLYV